jgi:hypothetical protein
MLFIIYTKRMIYTNLIFIHNFCKCLLMAPDKWSFAAKTYVGKHVKG